jgi:phenylalanyl-tRNA synthetase alpha chain
MPLNEIENNIDSWIETVYGATTIHELEMVKSSILGKAGVLTSAFKFMNSLPTQAKKEHGRKLNKARERFEAAIRSQKLRITAFEISEKLKKEAVDVTLPVTYASNGGLHIISQSMRKIRQHYQSRGFLVLDGPEVDTEFYNFDALNMPKHHPARQNHDTFYIDGFANTLLRTHTSTVQIRTMIEYGVPVRMISMGRTYRSDNLDATHSPMFHQLECLVVDREPVCVGHLKDELQKLLALFFETDEIAIKLRPSYFPFTEPGMEIDCQYVRNGKKQWLEIAGAGMVHPNVYKACGLGDDQLYGFAFAFGLERLIMLKYNISDIRNLYDTDLRILKHYA